MIKLFKYLKKVLDYAIFLWNDEDYDWAYILRLLDYKLKRHSDHLKEHNYIDETYLARLLKEIELTRTLLKRVDKNEYFDKLEKDIIKLYGKDYRKYTDKMGVFYYLVNGEPPKDFDTKFTDDERNMLKNKIIEYYFLSDKMQTNDLRRAFKLMSEHLQGWWC